VVPDAPQHIALSMSGPLPRMTDEVVQRAIGPLRKAAEAISEELRGR
jgi:IclR family acetate operon transcriptional repressor